MYKSIVVDDERSIQERLSKFFPWNEYGFTVVGTAGDGYAALKLVEEMQPDLIFTDIKMPMMNGLELAEQVSKHFPKTKVVILTAHDDFDYAKKAINYGVIGYLLKPIMKKDFRELMDNLKPKHFPDINEESIDEKSTPETPHKEKNQYVDFAIKYVREHYAEPIALKDIAYQIYIHEAYLSKLFNEKMGDGFSSYLNKVRVEEAKKLIMYTDTQLKDVAEKVGFSTYSYFNRVFKQTVGVTPLEFRRKHT